MILLKTPEDIKKIKKACAIWKIVRTELPNYVKPGITTHELDLIAKELIEKHGGKPTFYKLYDFPGYVCISVNDELIHGIGDNYVLKANDLITFDIGVTYQNHVCDAAFSMITPPSNNPIANKILNAAYKTLMASIEQIKPNNHIGDISSKTYEIAKNEGFEVIKSYGGHGCGNAPHEGPIILNYGEPNTGIEIVPNMVLCIEPMLMTNSDKFKIKPNKWTVYAKNHKLTCHYEHMVLVTSNGCEILTLSNIEKEQFKSLNLKYPN
ncbi:MAG: type I methionyl aminopeptidase [Mycoplasma sp.]|nr:type I methionyl aminopeptidase [Mycoplasma sp.]